MKNKLILGTVQFGLNYGINNCSGKPVYRDVKSILDYAFKNKINFLDTAEAYGDSHKIIGNYHAKSSNKFHIITKFCKHRSDLSKEITDRVFNNIKTLNVENIYCYMFHSFSDFVVYFDLFKLELLDLKKKGIIKKIGVSLHSNKEINSVLKFNEIDLIQFPYNLLDNNSKRQKVILKAKKMGVEIHTRSTFLQGLFFKDLDSIEGKLSCLKKYLDQLKNLVSEEKVNNLALNYVCSNSNIDAVLIGVDSVEQLKNNISCINSNKFNHVHFNIDAINVKEKDMLNPANW